jgi:hypothetical protein
VTDECRDGAKCACGSEQRQTGTGYGDTATPTLVLTGGKKNIEKVGIPNVSWFRSRLASSDRSIHCHILRGLQVPDRARPQDTGCQNDKTGSALLC